MSNKIAIDENKPWPANPFYCGERVYDYKVLSFAKTIPEPRATGGNFKAYYKDDPI
jgi:hypothetical protein